MVTYTMTPTEKERANTVKANLARIDMLPETLGKHYGRTAGHVTDVLRGRYTSGTLDTWLTNYEHYLKSVAGVRYIEPYLDDLEAE